jgi:hypothetical protein
MNDEVRRIAKSVHRWALRHRRKFSGLFINSDLAGMCAIASWELFKRLKAAGYNPLVCLNSYHAFVQLGRYIIDVTSKQFGKRAIEIRHIRNRDIPFWAIEKTADSKKSMKIAQKNWKKYQKHFDIR